MGAELDTRQRIGLGYPGGTDQTVQRRSHQPRVDINMLTPDNLLGRFDLLHKFFGHAGFQLVREFRNGAKIRDDKVLPLRAAADRKFAETVADTFGNAHQMSSPEARFFYITSLTAANKAIERFNQAIPEKDEIKGLNEVTVFDPSPSSILYYLNSPRIDKRLRFEIQRQIALGYIAGAIEARSHNSGLQEEIAKIQQIFNDSLYEGESGSVTQVETYAWHDNDTNAVVEMVGSERPRYLTRPNLHLKHHGERMRSVRSVGMVFSDFNIKDIESSILKAVYKAQRDKEQGNAGIVDIDVAVRDTIRAKMVVAGTDNIADTRIKKLIAKVTRALKKAEEEGHIKPIKSITRKDEKHDDPRKPRFKRLLIEFENLPIPFEIIFYDQKTHLNEQYHVGKMDEKGEFDGYSHRIYELQRLGKIFQAIWPEGVFQDEETGRPYITLQDLIPQQEVVAGELRGAYRVFPPLEQDDFQPANT